ncbi:hypothetical protein SDC9_178073 [bioreactor metagenome]|uniref:Uncharacterized protein n=1 Tax=bioreactor metagenome TaxID=1076179 RepID=A0A645GX35_9ZZZZ
MVMADIFNIIIPEPDGHRAKRSQKHGQQTPGRPLRQSEHQRRQNTCGCDQQAAHVRRPLFSQVSLRPEFIDGLTKLARFQAFDQPGHAQR